MSSVNMYSAILSDQQCLDIIKEKCGTDDFQIIDKRIAPISANTNGFLGIHLRATFRIILHGTPTTVQFFVKQQPFDPKHMINQFSIETRTYAKEAFLYGELIGRGKRVSWAPVFYLFKGDALVLDDASKDGFTLSPFKANEIDLEHCKVTLKAMAAFHAHSFHLEEKKSHQLGRPYRLDEEFSDILEVCIFHNKPNTLATDIINQAVESVEGLIDIMPENELLPKEQFKKKLNDLMLRTIELLKPSRRYRNVVCHGDLWLKNLLFKYIEGKPVQCLLIDFQNVTYSVPATDVLLCIYLNSPRAFIKLHLDELLQFYHTQLTSELKERGMNVQEILPWSEFMQSITDQNIVAQVLPIIYKSAIILDDDFFAGLVNDKDKYRDFMFINRTKYILNEYTNSSVYRTKITEIIDDLRAEITQIE